MDENTKHIVASNLTVAYCANRPSVPMETTRLKPLSQSEGFSRSALSEDEILAIYRGFLAQLDGSSGT